MQLNEKYKKLRGLLNVKVIKSDKILYKFMYCIFVYLSYMYCIFSIDHRTEYNLCIVIYDIRYTTISYIVYTIHYGCSQVKNFVYRICTCILVNFIVYVFSYIENISYIFVYFHYIFKISSNISQKERIYS